MQKIRDEEQRMNVRGYQADGGWARHQLENQRRWEGPPVQGAKVPGTLTIEQDGDGRWWGNKPAWGPFDTVRDLEVAVFGRSDLSGAKRDWRDEAPKGEE
jgi:hypothetical protein